VGGRSGVTSISLCLAGVGDQHAHAEDGKDEDARCAVRGDVGDDDTVR
jgi:hypothetical protein